MAELGYEPKTFDVNPRKPESSYTLVILYATLVHSESYRFTFLLFGTSLSHHCLLENKSGSNIAITFQKYSFVPGKA